MLNQVNIKWQYCLVLHKYFHTDINKSSHDSWREHKVYLSLLLISFIFHFFPSVTTVKMLMVSKCSVEVPAVSLFSVFFLWLRWFETYSNAHYEESHKSNDNKNENKRTLFVLRIETMWINAYSDRYTWHEHTNTVVRMRNTIKVLSLYTKYKHIASFCVSNSSVTTRFQSPFLSKIVALQWSK